MTPGTAAWVFPAWFATVIFAGLVGAWVAWPMAFDRGFEEATGQERHRHRIGDPQVTSLLELPRPGRLALALEPLEPLPGPDWAFFGAQPEPRPAAPAEYGLMTCQAVTAEVEAEAEVSGDTAPDETPSAWTRRKALEMDAYIKAMVEESNYFQHALKDPR